jgi:hypothetical protein
MNGSSGSRDGRFVQRGEEHSAAYQRQLAEAALLPGTDYSLPRKQFVDQSIDFTGVFIASAHEPIPADNKGYVLLQKMGWTGTGLGRSLDGAQQQNNRSSRGGQHLIACAPLGAALTQAAPGCQVLRDSPAVLRTQAALHPSTPKRSRPARARAWAAPRKRRVSLRRRQRGASSWQQRRG